MKILNRLAKLIPILLIVLIQFIFIPVPKVYAATTTINLGNVANFAVMGAAAITDTPPSTITGDVGLWFHGGASITGLQCIEVTGTIYDTDGAYTGNPAGTACRITDGTLLGNAFTSLNAAYLDAAGRGASPDILTNLGGQTLTAGVYHAASGTFSITAGQTLTLDGGGDANAVFIFKMATTLVTGALSKVVLTGSAQSCNVFWQVGSSASLGSGTQFIGNILADTSITDDSGSTVDGRLLAGAVTNTGAVTLNNTTVTKSTCATPTPTPDPTIVPASVLAASLTNSGVESIFCPALNIQIVTPIILDSRRVSPTSIFLSWGPYSGVNTFNVQYGPTNGDWVYNTDVVGFSTTINALPSNQPIWVRVGARSVCTIGIYGESKLIGGPGLPGTGFGSDNGLILNMSSLDFLYFSLAIGFLVLVGFVSYAALSLSKSLNELTSIFEKIDDIAKDANELKNIIKNGISILIGMFVKKGGDKNGK